jgi:leader peptidase (prepilin peptidase)/N-methyltransferase
MALIGPNYIDAAINAVIAALALYLLGLAISLAAKKEAMGSADVIVAGTMAALLGFPNFFVAMFLSAILALVPSLLAKDTMVPFVPFLALATFIVFLFDAQTSNLLNWIMYG